jgi:hypothetical protein
LKPDALKALGFVLPDWTKLIRLEASETATNQSALKANFTHLGEPPVPKKEPEAEATTPTPSEEPTSSTPWSIIAALIVAATGLMWLLVKKRK